MRYKMLYIYCFLFVSCCTNKTISTNKLIDIDVHYEGYTGSLDAVISNKIFLYPDSIKKKLADTSMREILLEGKNPYESRGVIIDFFSENRLRNKYKLSGYFSRVDSSNNNSLAQGKAAVFNVISWTKIKANR